MPINNYIKSIDRAYIRSYAKETPTKDDKAAQMERLRQRLAKNSTGYLFFNDTDSSQRFLALEFAGQNSGKLISCWSDYQTRPSYIKLIGEMQ